MKGKFSHFGLFYACLLVAVFAVGCNPMSVPSTRQANGNQAGPGGQNPGPGNGATTTGAGSGGETAPFLPTVEIRHLIEPNLTTDPSYNSGTGYHGGGSYVRKLTIPKNYAGRLYLAGINVGTLTDRFVKVRFKFGPNHHSETINAVVAKATGITPSTDISVLVMDLKNQPFRDIRLSYDLYDYNTYLAGETPVQDNRNSGLYCRALRLADDPTFTGVGNCDAGDEKCLYAYAKVLDQGLVKEGSGPVYTSFAPKLPQVKATAGSDYYADADALTLEKALSDSFLGPFKFNNLVNFNLAADPGVSIDWGPKTINSSTYYYRGPYKLSDRSNWHFKFGDLVGENRLFKNSRPYSGSVGPTPDLGTVFFGSYMFPLASKSSIQANTPYLGSDEWNQKRLTQINSVGGESLWMDGSSARAQTLNTANEHIGSCNVSAIIEIIAKDDSGNEYIITDTNEIKLQLVRETQYFEDTNSDVLYTNFKRCSSNSNCGSGECCYNNRCWDETLVSQCIDSTVSQGNHLTGEACSTDFDCVSLCCNRTTGVCAAHNTLTIPPVLCSKPVGDACIAKEWCQQVPVTKCIIVKSPIDPGTGTSSCYQQCYTVLEYGDCKAGTCVPPYQEPITSFDPDAPGACDNAVTAPNFN